jgi:hypothetical protein
VYALEGEAGRARDETERLQAELQSIQTDLEARVAENGFAAAQLAEAEDALAAANQRVAELEAAVQVCAGLCCHSDVSREGQFVDADPCACIPQALQEKVAVETDLAADLRAQLDSRGDAEARLGDAMKLNAQLGETLDDLNATVAALVRIPALPINGHAHLIYMGDACVCSYLAEARPCRGAAGDGGGAEGSGQGAGRGRECPGPCHVHAKRWWGV